MLIYRIRSLEKHSPLIFALEQESIIFFNQARVIAGAGVNFSKHRSEVGVEKIRLRTPQSCDGTK